MSTAGGKLIGFGNAATGYSSSYDRHVYMGPNGIVLYGVYVGSSATATSNFPLNDGKWHHAVATTGLNIHSLYIDGVFQGRFPGVAANYNGYWHIAADSLTYWPDVSSNEFSGTLDEVAIWRRNLSADEVLKLYRRGATRFKYRLRTCNNSFCADNQTWQGPDGTPSTYFSELLNTSGPTTQNARSPNLLLANYSALSVNANQGYIQYQGVWESDDINKMCTYSLSSAPCSAENTNMVFNRVNYDTTSPSVTNVKAIGYYALTKFSANIGGSGCPGGVTYTLSPDNVTYYYYTGAAWVPSNATLSQTSAAAQLSPANLSTYSSVYGPGKTYLRAYLTSTGTTPCSLQSIAFGGSQ